MALGGVEKERTRREIKRTSLLLLLPRKPGMEDSLLERATLFFFLVSFSPYLGFSVLQACSVKRRLVRRVKDSNMGERGSDGEWKAAAAEKGHLADRPSVIPVGKQWPHLAYLRSRRRGGAPAPREVTPGGHSPVFGWGGSFWAGDVGRSAGFLSWVAFFSLCAACRSTARALGSKEEPLT